MKVRVGVIVAAVVAVLIAAAVTVIVVFDVFGESPEQALASASAAVKDVSSMAFVMDMEMRMEGDATPMHMEGVMAYPSSSRLTMSMDLLGETVSYDQIVVDGVAYVKYPLLSTWGSLDLDITTSSPGQSASPTSYLAYLDAAAEVEDLGRDEVGGVECRGLRIDVAEEEVVDAMLEQTTAAGLDLELDPDMERAVRDLYESSEIVVEVWVGVADGLLRRQVIDMDMGESVEYTVHGVMEFSDFGEPVVIEAPANSLPINELFPLAPSSD